MSRSLLKFPTNGYHLIYFVSAVTECTYVAYDVNIIPALHKHVAAVFGDAAYIACRKKREKEVRAWTLNELNLRTQLLRFPFGFPLANHIGRNGELGGTSPRRNVYVKYVFENKEQEREREKTTTGQNGWLDPGFDLGSSRDAVRVQYRPRCGIRGSRRWDTAASERSLRKIARELATQRRGKKIEKKRKRNARRRFSRCSEQRPRPVPLPVVHTLLVNHYLVSYLLRRVPASGLP